MVIDFLATAFTKKILKGQEHEYKLSVAIAEKLLYRGDLPISVHSDGLRYPTVEMMANADNFAIRPEAIDRYFKCTKVEQVLVGARDGIVFTVKVVNASDKIFPDGAIVWD